MQIPLQITFRGLPPSPAIEKSIREHAAKLERFYDRLTRCRVVVESPHRRHNKGKLYHVSLDLTVPGAELVVNREPHQRHEHEDVYVAIRDAFNAAARQLEDYARRQRGEVKSHGGRPVGRVVQLFPEERYGFIDTTDGRHVYFHKNSLVNGDFETLEVGTPVEVLFLEAAPDRTPQATTVRILRP